MYLLQYLYYKVDTVWLNWPIKSDNWGNKLASCASSAGISVGKKTALCKGKATKAWGLGISISFIEKGNTKNFFLVFVVFIIHGIHQPANLSMANPAMISFENCNMIFFV